MPHPNTAGASFDRRSLILISLAAGDRHGYAVVRDIAEFAGITLAQTTVYSALVRLHDAGLIEPLGSDARRRPYRLTPAGARVLRAQLNETLELTEVGLTRLELLTETVVGDDGDAVGDDRVGHEETN